MNLIKTSAAAILAASIGLPASAAVGDGAFDAFVKICGAAHADYAAVNSVSTADGWKDSDVVVQAMSGVTATDRLSRAKTVAGEDLTLLATSGVTKNGLKVSTCTVYAPTADFAELERRAGAWLGFAPHDTAGQSETFHFTNSGAALRNVADADVETVASSAGGMQVLTVKIDGGHAILDLVKIAK
ncbi:MAG: hypothetical protein ACREFQ_12015 [Stellaceae bacterium]